jgi:hypothetical protein
LVFDQDNIPRSAWLGHLFSRGNCLCHPSILIRRVCYDSVGLYDERMASLPDLDMWVRLCLKYEIYVLKDKLVKFRLRQGETNASGNTTPNQIRARFEYKQILNHYLEINEPQFFLAVFPEAQKFGEVQKQFLPYFLARLALSTSNNSWQQWGLEILYDLINNREIVQGLENAYGFTYRDFYKLTSQYDNFNVKAILNSYPVSKIGGFSLNLDPHSNMGKIAAKCRRIFWHTAKK